MSSGIIHDATVHVGRYSQYSVGRPWASGNGGVDAPMCYLHIGWAEDAGARSGFSPLQEVIRAAIADSRRAPFGPERRAASLRLLARRPFAAPKWADGCDWTLSAVHCAEDALGSHRAAIGLCRTPEYRAAWLAEIARLAACYN